MSEPQEEFVKSLTVVVDDQCLAPFGTMRTRLFGAIADGGIDHEVVNFILAQLFQCILGEAFHISQVGQLERQDGHLVRALVVADFSVCFLGCRDITRTKDDAIRLRLLEKLLDGFEALVRTERGGEREIFRTDGWRMLLTMPEETPVATTVLAMDAIFADFSLRWLWDFRLFYNIMIPEW